MRGMFVGLFILASVWTGGLFWSLFGGMVVVPRSQLLTTGSGTTVVAPVPGAGGPTTGGPSTTAPAPQAAAQAQAKAAAPAAVTQKQTENGAVTEGNGGHGAISHAATVPSETKGNQQIEPKIADGVKVFELTAQVVKWEVAPGEVIDAWTYNGMVPGPLLRVTEGDKLKIVLKNELPEPTVIHVHGPMLPNSQDGVPDVTQPVVNPGETFTYEFEAKPAGTFLYHTHHNSLTQKSKGLYGVMQIDPKDAPKKYDREYFQVVGELGGFFVINGKAFPSTEVLEARVGERVMIHLVNLGEMIHPMHSHGFPTKIVGTDGHPVPEGLALVKDTVTVGPGERYDLEFVADNPGAWVYHCHILSHVQNKGVEPGGMISVVKITE